MRALPLLAIAVAALGCGSTATAPPLQFFDLGLHAPDLATPDLSNSDDLAMALEPGGIDGVVLDYTQSDVGVVPNALVFIDGFGSTRSDGNGHFHFDRVPAGDRLLVRVSKEDDVDDQLPWSDTELVTTVRAAETTYLYPRLFEGCYTIVPIDPASDGVTTLDDACGGARPGAWASLAWEASGVARSDGTVFAGNARVELMPIPFPQDKAAPPSLSWFLTLPGDLEAIRSDQSHVTLRSWGAAEFRLVDDATGEQLTIAQGHHATVQIEAYRTPPQGPQVVAWSFDMKQGYWIEEMLNGAFMDIGGPTDGGVTTPVHHVYQAQVTQLDWHSTDTPIPSGGSACISGTLTVGGEPAGGIEVTATGLDYGGTATTVTADDGSFCLAVATSANVDLAATFSPSQAITYRVEKMAATSASVGACGAQGQCSDAGTIDLPSVLPACATGRLRRIGNGVNPINMPVDVFVNLTLSAADLAIGRVPRTHLGQILPGLDGRFCAQLPSATTYELDEPSGCSASMQLQKPQDTGHCGTDEPNCEDVGEIDFCGGQPD